MVKMFKQSLATQPDRLRMASTTVSETKRTRGRAWMTKRERILKRDSGLCQACKAAGRLKLAFEVDHIVELADGGTDDDTNLQSLCVECHKDKTERSKRARAGR